ncbi:MAG: hypothetical protein KatS3mg015_3122 [Fimbriimonadales bacterium]|nr:MAG: hypothetical protein KatS3mg015_3122 [Fimbriimonadales bacterium]
MIARSSLIVLASLATGYPASAGAREGIAASLGSCAGGTDWFSLAVTETCFYHRSLGEANTLGPVSATLAPDQQATQARTYSAVEAKDHVGETATVWGTVASTRYAAQSRGQPTFLNLDAPYPNRLFTVVIWGEARASFAEPPERAYRGKRICVTGLIETYRGVPQIVVRTPAVIRIVKP